MNVFACSEEDDDRARKREERRRARGGATETSTYVCLCLLYSSVTKDASYIMAWFDFSPGALPTLARCHVSVKSLMDALARMCKCLTSYFCLCCREDDSREARRRRRRGGDDEEASASVEEDVSLTSFT